MLRLIYQSGNDSVALANSSIKKAVSKWIELNKKNPTQYHDIIIAQVDIINAMGKAIFEEKISHEDVEIIVEELDATINYNEEGILTSSWYEIVPTWDY